MNQVMNVDLYGASLADVDGTKYASLYIGQRVVDEKEENAKGIVVMKMPCDPSVYDSLHISEYPAKVELHFRLKKAAGGRMGQHCTAVVVPSLRSSSSGKSPTVSPSV
jgi:hypothetical protein